MCEIIIIKFSIHSKFTRCGCSLLLMQRVDCFIKNLWSSEEMYQHQKPMEQHCCKGYHDDESVDGEKQEMESSLRQPILCQLWQFDSVQKDDPHDVYEKHEGQS